MNVSLYTSSVELQLSSSDKILIQHCKTVYVLNVYACVSPTCKIAEWVNSFIAGKK